MYRVERAKEELIVYGPDGFKKRLPKSGIAVVLRWLGEEDLPSPCAVACSEMTDAEAVATALGINNAP